MIITGCIVRVVSLVVIVHVHPNFISLAIHAFLSLLIIQVNNRHR